MAGDDIPAVVRARLATVQAEAFAVGVVTEHMTEIVCTGRVAAADVHPDTVFYGASVTKQMMGLMLARVIADGRAGVDDSVSQWLPELPSWTTAVRVHHLIHHTSDLPDVTAPSLGAPRSNAEVIRRLQELPAAPTLEPGTRYRYNNAGYVLLAELLSRVLQAPMSDAASVQLFAPLTFSRTRLGGRPIPLPSVPDPPGTVGDGGLWTSVADLTRWLKACNEERNGVQAQRLAETTRHLVNGSRNSYAWGVRVTPTPYGRLVTHGGTWHGWVAKTARVPEQHVAVAVLGLGASPQEISDLGTGLARALCAQ